MDKEPKTLLDLTSEQIEELDRIKQASHGHFHKAKIAYK